MAISFLILACHGGFPVTVVAFWFIKIGEALNLALNNVYCATLQGGTSGLGLLHDSYGAGGTVGPFLATSMVVHGVPWAQFYCVTVACTVVNGITSSAFFREDESGEKDSECELLPSEDVESRQITKALRMSEHPPA